MNNLDIDQETGEDTQIDRETGEITTSHPETRNNETGEMEYTNRIVIKRRRRPFRITDEKQLTCDKSPSTSRLPDSAETTVTSPTYIRMGPDRISPALLFLLPTLFLAPLVTTIVGGIIEMVLHMWAHRKNSRNPNSMVRYQSPLYAVSREFCYACVDEYGKDKISKLQDKRREFNRLRNSIEYVRSVVT